MVRYAVIGLLVASACSSTAVPQSDAPTAVPTEEPVRGGELVERIAQDVKTLAPNLTPDGISARASVLIYAPLFDFDPTDGTPRPHLARWEQSEDGRTFDWWIRSDANWSDGRPIVAEDVLSAMWQFRAVPAAGGQRRAKSVIEGAPDFFEKRADGISGLVLDPADPKHFQVRLTGLKCTALSAFVIQPIPTHIFGKYLDPTQGDAIDRAPEIDMPPVASGPFKYEEWRRGETLRLTRNPLYFQGPALLDAYVFRVAGGDWLDLLSRGAFGYAQVDSASLGPADDLLERLAADDELVLHRTIRGNYTFIAWNTQSASAPALRDRRIRQALAYGLDGDLALARIYGGVGVRMDTHHLRGHWSHPGGLEPYDHDPAKARELIEVAGYRRAPDGVYERDGQKLSFTIKTNTGNKQREALVQLAADQYRALGIGITTKPVPFQELVLEVSQNETIEAVILGWSLDPFPDPYAYWHSANIPVAGSGKIGFNLARFADPRVDAAIDAARSGPDCSIAGQQQQYAIFNRVLNAEQPYYFGFSQENIRVVSGRLRGFVPGVHRFECCLDHHDVHRWWLAPEVK